MLVGGTLGSCVAAVDLARGTSREPLVAITVMFALATCGLLGLIGRARWTPVAYVGLVVVANIVYLAAYGPWIGLGGVYVLAIALAFLFMSASWSWTVGIALVTTPIIIGILHELGYLPQASALQLGDANNWQRAVTASFSALVGVAIVVNYTVRQMVKEKRNMERMVVTQREQRLERDRLDTEIARVRRADSIAQLAAEVGADIGAALAVIQARATALRAELTSVDAVECLSDIADVTTAAGGTMRSLTVFGPESVGPAHGNACEAVRVLPKLVRRIIPMRIALEIVAEGDLYVGVDTGDLSRIFANLALNARDAMPDRGTITIRVTREASHVQIDVRDTGTGMSPEVLNQLFQPFFTTKPVGRGTGLGLATSKILVERANGTISVASEVGKGTTFTIRLPLLVN